ncbi:MAG: hypothetical protein WC775_04730 [Patescibacteria group bacterium]|jgi:hypothetical protein
MGVFVAGAVDVEGESVGAENKATKFDRVTAFLSGLSQQERDELGTCGALISPALDLVEHGVIKQGQLAPFLRHIFGTLSRLAEQKKDIGTSLMQATIATVKIAPEWLTGITDPGTFWWNRFRQEFVRVADKLRGEMMVERGLTGPFAVYRLDRDFRNVIRTSTHRSTEDEHVEHSPSGDDRNTGVVMQAGVRTIYEAYCDNQARIQQVRDTHHSFAGASEKDVLKRSIELCDRAGVGSNWGMYMVQGEFQLRADPAQETLRILLDDNGYCDVIVSDFLALPPTVAGKLTRGDVQAAQTAYLDIRDSVRLTAMNILKKTREDAALYLQNDRPNDPKAAMYQAFLTSALPDKVIEDSIIRNTPGLSKQQQDADVAQRVLAALQKPQSFSEWDPHGKKQPLLSVRLAKPSQSKDSVHENQSWFHMAGAGRELATLELETGLFSPMVEVANPYGPDGATRKERRHFGEAIKGVRIYFGHLAIDGSDAKTVVDTAVRAMENVPVAEHERIDFPHPDADDPVRDAMGFKLKTEVYKYPPRGIGSSVARHTLDSMLGHDASIARILGATEYNVTLTKNEAFVALSANGRTEVNRALRVDDRRVSPPEIRALTTRLMKERHVPEADIAALVKVAESLIVPKQLATWALAASITAVSERANAVCAVPGRDAHRLFVSTLGVYGLPVFTSIKEVVFNYLNTGERFESFADFWHHFQPEFFSACKAKGVSGSELLPVFAESALLLFQETADARMGAGVVPAIDTLSGNAALKALARKTGGVLVPDEAPIVDGQYGQVSNLGAGEGEFMTALSTGYSAGVAAIGPNLNIRRRADAELFARSFVHSYDFTMYPVLAEYGKTPQARAHLAKDKELIDLLEILSRKDNLGRNQALEYMKDRSKYTDKAANLVQRFCSFLAEAVVYADKQNSPHKSVAQKLIKDVRTDARWLAEDQATEIAFLQELFGALPYLSRTQGKDIPLELEQALDKLVKQFFGHHLPEFESSAVMSQLLVDRGYGQPKGDSDLLLE